jgi:sporulation protein YlmC with PRC-barrel domain
MQTTTGTGAGAGGVATDETDRLISSTKVEGTKVYDRRGERLGTISSFMVDKYSGQVAYAVLSSGGFLGLGPKSCHPLPWRVLSYDTGQGGYVVDLDKDTLAGAPGYAVGESPDWSDPSYGKGIDTYYDRPDRPRDEAAIDAAVDDTFPASDPPSWSGGATGAGAPEEGR